MTTLKPTYEHLIAVLGDKGIESPDLEARFILRHRFGVEWGDIIADPGREIPEATLKTIENDLGRRIAGEPLSRIHGTREFHGLEFLLGPETLDPRPDTEVLVNQALKLFHGKQFPKRILDLGTGTGCIIISLLKEWPDSTAVAVDLSPGALEIARLNAKTHGVLDRLELLQGSWADGIEGQFDLIVSNPPYIPSQDIANLDPEVRNHDPILALDGGFDGLDAYRQIFFSLKRLLTPCGKALFEIGVNQEEGIARLSRESRIRVNNTHPDLAGIPRVVEILNGDN